MLFVVIFLSLLMNMKVVRADNDSLTPADRAWIEGLVKDKDDVIKRYQARAMKLMNEGKKLSKGENPISKKSCPNSCAKKTDFIHKQNDDSLADNQLTTDNDQQTGPKIFVFVSSSIPDETIKAYGKVLKKLKGNLVFRGIKSNSFAQMAQYLKKLGVNAMIDPTLFEKYQVAQVPVIVVAQSDTFDRIDGNITVMAALEKISINGDLKKEANHFVNLLKDSFQ